MTDLFTPETGAARLDVDTSSDRVALPKAVNPTAGTTVRVFVEGTDTVFVNFGTVAVTATIGADKAVGTGIPCAGGRETGFRLKDGSATYIAAITAAGTSTIYVTMGDGI